MASAEVTWADRELARLVIDDLFAGWTERFGWLRDTLPIKEYLALDAYFENSVVQAADVGVSVGVRQAERSKRRRSTHSLG